LLKEDESAKERAKATQVTFSGQSDRTAKERCEAPLVQEVDAPVAASVKQTAPLIEEVDASAAEQPAVSTPVKSTTVPTVDDVLTPETACPARATPGYCCVVCSATSPASGIAAGTSLCPETAAAAADSTSSSNTAGTAAASLLYTCPKCRSLYCGIACYKAHSQHCTESFYEEQVRDNLPAMSIGGLEERKELEKMLGRLRRLDIEEDGEGGDDSPEGADDDDAGLDADLDLGTGSGAADGGDTTSNTVHGLSQERLLYLVDLASSGDLDLGDLTEQEQQLFKTFIEEDAAGVVGQWEPWWMRIPVEEEDGESDEEDGDAHSDATSSTSDSSSDGEDESSPNHDGLSRKQRLRLQREADDLPTFRDVETLLQSQKDVCAPGGSQPNPLTGYTIAELLYNYAIAVRLANGEEPLVWEYVLSLFERILGREAGVPPVESVRAWLKPVDMMRKCCNVGGGERRNAGDDLEEVAEPAIVLPTTTAARDVRPQSNNSGSGSFGAIERVGYQDVVQLLGDQRFVLKVLVRFLDLAEGKEQSSFGCAVTATAAATPPAKCSKGSGRKKTAAETPAPLHFATSRAMREFQSNLDPASGRKTWLRKRSLMKLRFCASLTLHHFGVLRTAREGVQQQLRELE